MRNRMNPGLPLRVAAAVGLISFIAALIVSIPTYLFTRNFLVEQREKSAVSRTLVDTEAVNVALTEGLQPGQAIDAVPSVADSQPMLWFGGSWYTKGVTVSPADLPADLLSLADDRGGAMQRFTLPNGDPYLAIAAPVRGSGTYVEVFPLSELQEIIDNLGLLLAISSAAALAAGAVLGSWAGRRILRPLTEMASVATRITHGDLSARMEPSPDPDLGRIGTVFNDMAATVESRLERERRFSANVSHELRSPLTGILGTAELLEGRTDVLPERETALITALVGQVRRFSSLVLDLLELGQVGGDRDVVPDLVDLAELARFVLQERDLPPDLVRGNCSARTDPRRLERILANLIDNALAHGEGVRMIAVQRVDGGTEICVDDNGPGVPIEDRERIFEPFNRGRKTDRKGSGLGLAIVSEQARLIGATVTIEDAPAGGARFRVFLIDQPL